ncbi:MAG: hypothetical protein EXS05_11200 [Planctomycetaceae bacterium]|nr:hypothetical protein [Planctomycetaceae bacterium]
MLPLRQFAAVSFSVAAFAVAALMPVSARACPFCSAPSLTLSEQFAQADSAVLVKWVGGKMPKDDEPGSTQYEVVDVARSPFKWVEKGYKLTLEHYRTGKKGSLALLLGSRTKGDLIEWGAPLDATETVYKYIVEAPEPKAAAEKRLPYYLKFLEHPDPILSADAYAEFAGAAYKDIVKLTDELPREKLRGWLVSPNIQATRLGLYGLMLGLCGEPADATLMEQKIVEDKEEYRFGINGVIGGYLLLTGEKGLDLIEKAKFSPTYQDKKVSFSESYAAMQALQFLWTDGKGRIRPERLKSSMRLLLDRPDLADLVIEHLARWKDWSLQERLMEIYGQEEYDTPSVKRAVIRFMIASTKDVPAGGGEAPPEHAVHGAKNIEQLRNKDPKMVNDAERFFFLY